MEGNTNWRELQLTCAKGSRVPQSDTKKWRKQSDWEAGGERRGEEETKKLRRRRKRKNNKNEKIEEEEEEEEEEGQQ